MFRRGNESAKEVRAVSAQCLDELGRRREGSYWVDVSASVIARGGRAAVYRIDGDE